MIWSPFWGFLDAHNLAYSYPQQIQFYVLVLYISEVDKCSEGVVAPYCNPLTLQPEQSGGWGSNPTSTFERHDKGSRTRLAISAIPVLGAENRNFTFTFTFRTVEWIKLVTMFVINVDVLTRSDSYKECFFFLSFIQIQIFTINLTSKYTYSNYYTILQVR